MILTTLLALATLVMRLFPQTPAARWLHLHMVELPLALIARLERKHILFLIVAVAAAQPLMMMGAADLAMIAAWDMAIYADVTMPFMPPPPSPAPARPSHQLRSRATALAAWQARHPGTAPHPVGPAPPAGAGHQARQ
jgi:hypothetical protein